MTPRVPLHFPPSQRVIYKNNPLNEVVCQIRFPTILKITSGVPAAFQELIRSEFPDYAEEINALTAGLPAPLLQLLSNSNQLTKRHKFASRDGRTAVILDGQALTFTTGAYIDWEHFSSQVHMVVSAFRDTYLPTFLSRIGLRYQNLIAAPPGEESFRWTDYIREELVGVLALDPWADATFECQTQLRSRLENTSDRLFLQYGLVTVEGVDGLHFSLDFDYYVEEETSPNDAEATIERLHGYSGRAFQWAIQKRLHSDLGPDTARGF